MDKSWLIACGCYFVDATLVASAWKASRSQRGTRSFHSARMYHSAAQIMYLTAADNVSDHNARSWGKVKPVMRCGRFGAESRSHPLQPFIATNAWDAPEISREPRPVSTSCWSLLSYQRGPQLLAGKSSLVLLMPYYSPVTNSCSSERFACMFGHAAFQFLVAVPCSRAHSIA